MTATRNTSWLNEVKEIGQQVFFLASGALFGAMVGSFLNVCIYRLPRGLSVSKPARSFCPGCERTIPWFWNIPVLSWLMLRGRCVGCRQPISPRYLVVEVVTAVLFAGVVWKFGAVSPLVVLPYFLFVSLLLVATFVDLEHMIIPDEVTWGGVVLGILCSGAIPELQASASVAAGAGASLLGAAAGYGVLWGVVEFGRLVFGRRKFTFDEPVAAVWTRSGETAELVVDGEVLEWSGLFPRGTETVVMEFEEGCLEGRTVVEKTAVWKFESLRIGGESVDLNTVERFSARVRMLVLPREVMGYGDVKFLAAIGAFTGWKAVFFTLMAGSFAGALFGMLALLLGRREWSGKIPFGPYLAFGAFLWLAIGEEAWKAYWGLLTMGR